MCPPLLLTQTPPDRRMLLFHTASLCGLIHAHRFLFFFILTLQRNAALWDWPYWWRIRESLNRSHSAAAAKRVKEKYTNVIQPENQHFRNISTV